MVEDGLGLDSSQNAGHLEKMESLYMNLCVNGLTRNSFKLYIEPRKLDRSLCTHKSCCHPNTNLGIQVLLYTKEIFLKIEYV
jgi:hypothetical protein